MRGKNAFMVGGGNSASKAAVNVAGHARTVTLLVRRPDLSDSVSAYLNGGLQRPGDVEIRTPADGDDWLRGITDKDLRNNGTYTLEARAVCASVADRATAGAVGAACSSLTSAVRLDQARRLVGERATALRPTHRLLAGRRLPTSSGGRSSLAPCRGSSLRRLAWWAVSAVRPRRTPPCQL